MISEVSKLLSGLISRVPDGALLMEWPAS